MPKYLVLVDTIECHTRRYEIEAVDEGEAESIVYGEALLEYTDSFERLEGGDNDFAIVEVEEIE